LTGFRIFDNLFLCGLTGQTPGPGKEAIIGRLRRLSGRELRKLLQEHGFIRLKGRGRGSHEVWRNPQGIEVVIAARDKDIIPTGTLKSILRQTGIPEDGLR
jgi:predicted RNA binding protein YcfA (HicA-like mRNA interferase family)